MAPMISTNGFPLSAGPEPAHGLTVPLERQIAEEQLMSKLPQSTLTQCVIRNQEEALEYVKHRVNEPFSTRECF